MKLSEISEIQAGDVLLCYKDKKIDPIRKGIRYKTDSDYTHAAICIAPSIAVESTLKKGVAKVEIKGLLELCDHIAIFRQPDAWNSTDSVRALNTFIDSIIASGAKYNLRGIAAFKNRKDMHDLSLTEQLEAFFSDSQTPAPVKKEKYFCSELVADCFVATGFIEPSAAVVYKSEVTSPGALGRDPTFGTFYGYASPVKDYAVPIDDEFYHSSTFNSIFKADA